MALSIVAVPSDAHGETNLVYTSPADAVPAGTLVKVGEFYFTTRPDDAIARGTIAMNLMQRRCAKVTTNGGDMVVLPTGGSTLPYAVVTDARIQVEYVAATKKGGTIDYPQFVDRIFAFDGQFFAQGQQMLVVVAGVKYVATITVLNSVAMGGGAAAQYAQFVRDKSKIILAPLERCEIGLTNEPEDTTTAGGAVKDFDLEKLGIGGLRAEFGQVFRRAFASRIFPQAIVKKLGIRHVKGLLLYGPPGTGKTLIARKIGEILNCKEPKIVNGPEIFSKWIGQAEENIRKLFADAEAEQKAKGDKSQLHLIIFDEFDAICKQRGAVRDNTGVGDNVVNQLLSKIDGVEQLNNVLLIGMTNRKDLIDEAILRPGRFEVHVEIGLPDEEGRLQILRIHTRGMSETHILDADVDFHYIAAHTKNFSGAEIEGLVRSAQSHAFSRHIDFDRPTEVKDTGDIRIKFEDFKKALEEVKPALGRAEDECETVLDNGIINYGEDWENTDYRAKEFVRTLATSPKMHSLSILLTGAAGTGKSGLAAHMAMSSEFPYVKFISSNTMVGYGEVQKANILRKAFDDAHKSTLSVIVLDDIERLVEYSHLGGRYSNVLLQTLMVLIKRPPPEGKKVLVIGTATNLDIMEALELVDCFSASMELQEVPAAALGRVVRGLGAEFADPADEPACIEALVQPVAMKRLIFLIEMACIDDPVTGKRKLNSTRFLDAILSTGRVIASKRR